MECDRAITKDKIALLRIILAALDHHRVHWCVVGDDRHIGTGFDNDCDIVVSRSDLRRVPGIVRSAARRGGASLVQDIQHEAAARFLVFAWLTPMRPGFLHIDICADYHRDARLLLSADQILAQRQRMTVDAMDDRALTYWRPHPCDNLVYYLLKKVDKGAFDRRQIDFLRGELATAGPTAATAALGRVLPRDLASDLLATLAGDAHHRLHDLRLPVRHALERRRRVRCADLARRLLRLVRPTGLLVALPDDPTFARQALLVVSRWREAFRRDAIESWTDIGRWTFLRRATPRIICSWLLVVGLPPGRLPLRVRTDVFTGVIDDGAIMRHLRHRIVTHRYGRVWLWPL